MLLLILKLIFVNCDLHSICLIVSKLLLNTVTSYIKLNLYIPFHLPIKMLSLFVVLKLKAELLLMHMYLII